MTSLQLDHKISKIAPVVALVIAGLVAITVFAAFMQ